MPLCESTTIKDVITLKPEQTVKEAMSVFKENDIRSIPVLGDDGEYLGLFGLRHVLTKLLPKAVQMKDGLDNLDFIEDATPGIAKRLQKLHSTPVSEVMNPDALTISPNTATWEALRLMALHGSPVSIVNKETGKFEGLISRQTLLDELESYVEQL